jgi:hypothetical protein
MNIDPGRDRAIDLARKLLAKAEGAGVSDAEAQAFAAKAAEIMLRHNLTDAVVRAAQAGPSGRAEPLEVLVWTVSGVGGHGRHRLWGISTVAEAYGCATCAFGNDITPRSRSLHIVGTTADLDTLQMLLPAVAAIAETSAAQGARRRRDALAAQGWYTRNELDREARLYRRSFLVGFGQGVAGQISRLRVGVVDELRTATTGADLVLLERHARVLAEFTRRYPKLRKGRSVRTGSTEGRNDGIQAGRNMPLGGNSIDDQSDRPELDR